MKRVVVGLSGGVDSSVAAYLLQQQGYDVIGIYMRNWSDNSVTINGECPWIDDSNDANLIAEQLGIPFQVLDFSAEYKQRIVDYMFAEYEKGRTPNPDILCNREIKFDLFLKAAIQLDADFVATGHYCQKETIDIGGKETHRLLAGADPNKDQSYFLCQVSQEQLSKALFPIGHLQKPEVRIIAQEAGLVTAEKKDSQGLCFIGKVKLPDFLQQQLKTKTGKVYEIPASKIQLAGNNPVLNGYSDAELAENTKSYHFTENDGELIGEHQGAHFYTIGQRKGLNIGGKAEPLFIVETDAEKNIVYTGQGKNHPALLRKGLFIANSEIHWIRPDLALKPEETKNVLCRIRYRQPLEEAKLFMKTEGLYIIFKNYQRGIAKGQFAAWYEGNELIGSGVID